MDDAVPQNGATFGVNSEIVAVIEGL